MNIVPGPSQFITTDGHIVDLGITGGIYSQPEPAPIKNDLPAVWDLVIKDMRDRDQFGRAKYHTPLQPFNGRDALIDAYQEALDLIVYLRRLIYERDGK